MEGSPPGLLHLRSGGGLVLSTSPSGREEITVMGERYDLKNGGVIRANIHRATRVVRFSRPVEAPVFQPQTVGPPRDEDYWQAVGRCFVNHWRSLVINKRRRDQAAKKEKFRDE